MIYVDEAEIRCMTRGNRKKPMTENQQPDREAAIFAKMLLALLTLALLGGLIR